MAAATSDAVGKAEGWKRWWARRVAGHGGESAHSFCECAEAGTRPVWTELSEAADTRQHETGVFLHQHLGAEVPAFKCAGAEAFNYDVGFPGDTAEDLLCLGMVKVQRNRTLVAGD